jgi:predicted alpha-1,2-mannosidase
MKKFYYLTTILLLFVSSCGQPKSVLHYVDPLIGTANTTTISAQKFGEHTELLGNTFPAVGVPHGLTNWTPQTRDSEQKCLSPYYYADSLMQGFRAGRWMDGSCTQDYGSVTLMPVTGTLACLPEKRASLFRHDREVSTPAYYSAYLETHRILVEMTGLCYTALFRFTFDQAGKAYLVINPNSDEGEGFIEIDADRGEVRGYNPVHRIYQGWGMPAGFKGYFVLQFDKPFVACGTYEGETTMPQQTSIANRKNIGAYIEFDVKKQEVVVAKMGTSFTGIEGARKNMKAEALGWNFDRMRRQSEQAWEKELSVIEVTGGTDEQKKIFYTALYHSHILPRIYSDADGTYPAFVTGELETDSLYKYYCDFSMWDVYRAALPLGVITNPDRSRDLVQSLIKKYEIGGWMPVFPSWNSYTAAMIGDHGAAFIGDCYMKGIRGFDMEKAWEGMRKNAFESMEKSYPEEYKDGKGRRGLLSYMKYGYIPLEDSVWDAFHRREQVSRTLEYAYDDFVLSQVAQALGKTDDYQALRQRAANYRNVIDPKSGWCRGRYADGRFIEKFDPSVKEPFITEGTPRHYTWYVPHDPLGLMEAMGGRERYVNRLDSMFTEGYYWHGNEPSHQIAFMFNYAGQPWKTQQYVRDIMHVEYNADPGGLCGNEDAGQMSAWYVFAAMGFYPVCPGVPQYALASPLFPEVKIHLSDGKKFTIISKNVSDTNKYIQSATLNHQPYNKSFITHEDILSGSTLVLEMGDTPDKEWATSPESIPYSMMSH